MNNFIKIIKEICNELNIKYTFLSKDWVIMLEYKNKTRFLSGYKFDLNKHALGLILDDKYAMYDVLNYKNIPVIKHDIVYQDSNNNLYAKDCKGLEYAKKLFSKYQENIVLKINNGTCGRDIYHVNNLDDLINKYNKLMIKHSAISICPFYDIINEYRAILINGQIKLLYKKIKPRVVGDSKKTIKELLQEFNPEYFKDYNEDNKNIILKQGEVFEYDWKFNLSRGSLSSLDILESDKIEIINIIDKINEFLDLKFVSVDIIKTVENKFYVMEINSGVMMENFINQHENGEKIAKEIYKEAILEMFK